MSLDLNDPRLTAYVLNELEPQERAEIERLLADDPAARELVNDLSDTASFLELELQAEVAPELTTTQKEAVLNGHIESDSEGLPVGKRDSRPRADKNILPFPSWKYVVWGMSAAATIMILSGLMFPAMQGSLSAAKKAKKAATDYDSGYVVGQTSVAINEMKSGDNRLVDVNTPLPTPDESTAVPTAAPSGGAKTEVLMASSGSPSAPSVPVATITAPAKEMVSMDAKWNPPTSAKPASISGALAKSKDALLIQTADTRAGVAPNGYVGRPFSYPFNARPVATSNSESYTPIAENDFFAVAENPLSTFSIDVDTASYANIRRFIDGGQRPPADAVRIEEMVNYFPYNYATPTGEDPFAANVEIADCPWDREHRLVRIGLKGREIARNNRPASNLVFLIDVSGSMNDPAKLPLVKASLQMLVNKLTARDRIAIAVYAGNSGLVLPSTAATPANKERILGALEQLSAGGSTNGGEGIQLAYALARQNFIKGGTNRVILCTDGDFNVGVTSQSDLVELIKQEAKGGVFLSVCGFGSGNLKDSTMMNLADKGNGNYAYIDSLKEGRKVFVEQMSGTLVTIAKDVKIQIEFNPGKVGAYRLIGYEKRMLAKEDFNNDKKDAGEIGAGHTVTALYEIVPVGRSIQSTPGVDPLKYQNLPSRSGVDELRSVSDDLFTLKIRYKQPDGATSKKLEFPIKDRGAKLEQASGDFKFAASVAAYGMVLRGSDHGGDATLDLALQLARAGKGEDEEGYRAEFIRLIKATAELP